MCEVDSTIGQIAARFLDAKDFKLSNDEILNLLWPDGNGTLNNLHTNIKRLRGYLSRISNYKIENKNFSYQLKIPISSKKSQSK